MCKMLRSMEYSVLIEYFWLPLKYAFIGSVITGSISLFGVVVEHLAMGHLLMIFEHALEYAFYIPLLAGMIIGGFSGFLYGKRLQQRDELSKKIRKLEVYRELNKVQKKFVTTVSHEFRTPITVLNLSVNNLVEFKEKITEKEQNKLLDVIKSTSDQLSKMIKDLIIITRIDEQHLEINKQMTNLYELFCELLLEVDPLTQAKEITIENQVDKNIEAFIDPLKLTQVFRIILDNAIRYSHFQNNICITCKTNYNGHFTIPEKPGILLQIMDSGRGIRPEDIPHIFERFYRSKEVENITGSGLGLSIAQEILRLHNGDIYVESEYGKGTTVSVFLPDTNEKSLIEEETE